MRGRRASVILAAAWCAVLLWPGTGEAASFCAPDGVQPSGAVYRICMPAPGAWNGSLVVWAHGYVNPGEPVAIPEDQLVLPDGTSLPAIANGLGFAFATSSYRRNGLVIQDGLDDLRELVQIFVGVHGAPVHVLLIGASEGGIITALGVERYPDVFSGGLATCGPIGDFPSQINYLGDFRVVFDYFFPRVIPGSAEVVPDEVQRNWERKYVRRILRVLKAHPDRVRQLLAVTGAPVDPADPATIGETVLAVLRYSVFASANAGEVLGGQPFDNATRVYQGSDDDAALNAGVQRVAADPAAVAEMQARYQTTGVLSRPLVTLHTTGDPEVPYFHEPMYRLKTLLGGSGRQHVNIRVQRYGHCNFTVGEAVLGFLLLVLKVEAPDLPAVAEPPALTPYARTVAPAAASHRVR